MKLKYLCAYENLGQYLDHLPETDAWEQIMIAPFWRQITEWAPFPVDYLKPKALTDRRVIMNHIERFKKYDVLALKPEFEQIAARLPKADDDPLTIAFYPSDTGMEEGVFGTGTWGNMIISINPVNDNALAWTPFVFAHEYHHNVLGNYWYCVKEGKETTGNFLEAVINEGQADVFAQSLYPALFPSWLKGVSADDEQSVWEKLKTVLYTVAPAEEFAPWMFGSEELEIPPYAGYYFGHAIVKDYMRKHPEVSFSELVQTPHQVLFNESRFA